MRCKFKFANFNTMAELKTKKTKETVSKFLAAVENEDKRKDAKILLKLFTEITKEKPALWGTAIVGFGTYSYKSERSKQAGDWFMVGFSPRKTYLAVYIIAGINKYEALLKKLGKFKVSTGSCLYINKLADIDLDVLKEIIGAGYQEMQLKHG